jgi:TonB family protein
MLASDLDEALPNRRFVNWFNETIGPSAGVVWQLTECGEHIGAPGEPGYDMPACAEISAMLPDWRKIFVAISVGTFKKGMIGKPSFFSAVVEWNERLYQISRLSDLPDKLRDPERHAATRVKNRISDLPTIKATMKPTINTDPAWVIATYRFLAPPSSIVQSYAGDQNQEEKWPTPTPLPLPPRSRAPDRVPERLTQSRAIIKIKPDYPMSARKMNATGKVEVEITISETGLVIEATAVSGHLAIRNPAVEAARKWVFKPATFNSKPVRVRSVLTFVFGPGGK